MLAKSKLNSIENLISQALIDLEIIREEFKTITKEKQKYKKMKERIKMINSLWRESHCKTNTSVKRNK